MTPDQITTLRTYIDATPELSAQPINDDGAYEIARLLNQPSNPAFIVWRTSVMQDSIMQNGFDWTRVDNLSVGPARVWEWMFANASRAINPSKLNVRAGIDAVWKGTAADLAVRAAVYVHCKRTATVIEKILATGTGTDATPGSLTFEGQLSPQWVVTARNL
jgi:hypothetical protein